MDVLAEFKKVAPYIAGSVKARTKAGATDAEVMEIIHEEILRHFETHQKMTLQYLSFSYDERADFARAMHPLIKPLTEGMQSAVNPRYEEFVQRTGQTGARNYIING